MTTRRTKLTARPWLGGAVYDKYTGANTVHFDLYAWRDDENWYFEIEARESGKSPLAWSCWRYEPLFDVLTSIAWDDRPGNMRPARWAKTTAHVFARVHAFMLDQCVVPAGYTAQTTHVHYVKAYDGDPWPRGTLNTYAPPAYGEGRKPGRPKKVSVPVDMPDVL